MHEAHIGTSGWSYKSWEKTFYPPDIPQNRHFQYYAGRQVYVYFNNDANVRAPVNARLLREMIGRSRADLLPKTPEPMLAVGS